MDAGILDEHDAHERQSRRDVQILRGGLDAEHTDKVAAPDVQRHAHQIRHIPFAVFAQQPDEEIVDGGHDRLKDSLTLGDVLDPQIPRQQDRTENQKRHDAPADDHRLRDGKPEDRDHFNVQLFF